MIRCPSCGTRNPDSRKACNRCGKALPQTAMRCPKCGTLNAVGNIFCDGCNARLIESSQMIPPEAAPLPDESEKGPPLKGISLPSRAGSSQGAGASSTDLPDWMLDFIDDDEASPDIEQAGTTESSEGGYAEWLSDLLGEGIQDSEGTDETRNDDLGPALALEELPDWLASGSAVTDTTPDPEAVAEELPEWLRSISDQLGPSRETEPATAALPDWLAAAGDAGDSSFEAETLEQSDALPDWLTAGQGEVSTQGVTGDTHVSPVAEGPFFEESFDWLLGEEEAETAGTTTHGVEEAPAIEPDLPDWLAEARMGDRDEVARDSAAERIPWKPVTTGDASVDDAEMELPDWLTDIGAVPTGAPSAIFTSSADAIVEGSSSHESPTSLEDAVVDTPPDSAVPPSVPVFVGEEVEEELPLEEDEPDGDPSWLQSLELNPTEEPEDLTHVDAALERAELPGWLQNMRPPEAGGPVARGDMPGTGGALSPADIPDWVQAMRPIAGDRGTGVRDRVGRATPAEPDGPLVGLPGVLPALTWVDMPPTSSASVDHAISAAVMKQAQLWQHLLEQPRSAERPITQSARGFQSSALVRVIVSLTLLLSLFAAILFLPENLSFVQTTPLQVAPGAADLVRSLDLIEPGQSVLIAFDYAPAYADEMAQIARPILEHLDDRQAQLILVSTLPEGTGLGMALLDEVRYEGTVTSHGYIAGYYSGIASFLGTADVQSVAHVVLLTSQSEHFRWWVEQLAVADSQQRTSLPFSAGVTASARPLVAPYLQTGEVQGWIAGLSGGLAYREARGETLTGFYSRAWNVLMLGHWFVVALLVIGVLYSLVAGKKGAR